MKAWVLHGIGDIRYEERKRPKLQEGEVLVQVRAVGICGSDIPRIFRTGAHVHPLIPGHEFSGQVVDVACDVSADWKGKKVGVFPLIPCRECGPCRNRQYEMCRNYSYLGSRCDGGFAEYVAVPEWNLIELPEEVPYAEAAMMEPMAVAVHAMRRVHPVESDRIVVCGLGTIGLLLVQFLLEAGCRKLWVIGNKDSQRGCVEKLGLDASHFCDSRSEDVEQWVMERTDGSGADVFFECVGRNETLLQAVDLTAPGKRVMLVGNPYSDMELPKQVYWKILRNQLSVLGTWNSSYTRSKEDDWHYVAQRLCSRSLRLQELITHRYGLSDLEQGLSVMRDKTEDYGKVMVEL